MSLLVLVVLLGMWGFVLYPLVRSRNSRVDEIRSVARFSSALRVLSAGSGGLVRPGGSRRTGLGMRQLHMPPRVGIEAVRAARAARMSGGRSAAGRSVAGRSTRVAPPIGAAALRRRQVLGSATGFFALSLLLFVFAHLVLIQVLADLSLVAAVALCRWSAQQERAQQRAQRRRSRGSRAVPVSDGEEPAAEPLVMTVPLDAPPMPRRAVPPVHASPAADPPASRPAVAARPGAPRPGAARIAAADVAPEARPRIEPPVLAEIDIDWDPVIPEPASMVRVVELDRPRRRAVRLFDDGDEAVDVGDDDRLDVLVSRRAAASGW